jgi:hypothetical protein
MLSLRVVVLKISEIKLGMVVRVIDEMATIVIGSKVWADPAVASEERRFVFSQQIHHILVLISLVLAK